MLIFGDSWVAGYAAKPSTEGFAYLVGRNAKWKTTVDGVAGSGFIEPGPNDEGTYRRRIGALSPALDPRLVIVEGGINDAEADRSDYVATVEATVRQLQRLYPNADVLLVGPGAYVLPPPPNLVQTDGQLAQAASNVGIPYISPISERWITAENFDSVIDTSAGYHPSTHGHAVIAARLESDLKRYIAP